MTKQKLAIIGANYLQKPLVKKANQLGIETHVFAWRDGNVAARIADYYYPISIIEKETVLEKCLEVEIDGITSVGSDVAMPTVNYVADKMNLIGNSLENTNNSTNKFEMRKRFQRAGLNCPKFCVVDKINSKIHSSVSVPLIVKPIDRSGSIGVKKVETAEEIQEAVKEALDKSYISKAIVEEYINGKEYSVEMISNDGKHHFLAVTEKVTTGPPYFVEIAHHQPAEIPDGTKKRIIETVKSGIDALGLKNGATHSEVMLVDGNKVFIIEIAGRMGGCFIGSHMVRHSTGYDYLKGIIEVALGQFDNREEIIFTKNKYSGVYYVVPKSGRIKKTENYSYRYSEIVESEIILNVGDVVSEVTKGPDNRAAIFVYEADKKLELNPNDVIRFTMDDL